MDLQKELVYQEYVQRENDILRAPYDPELEFYSYIKAGDVELVQKLCSEPLIDKEGLGTLSQNPLQNMKYHFVITTAMVARYCIEGGMEVSESYSLSDFYIQKVDKMTNAREISDLHPIMCLDYANRMKQLRKDKICSKPIAQCLDYIYDHLHTRITVTQLAEHVGLSDNYVSRLFKKEVGISISQYIQNKKIETAKNMLIYSEYTVSSIAMTLAFPSQSYFTELFHKKTGLTPVQFRSHYYRSTELGNKE